MYTIAFILLCAILVLSAAGGLVSLFTLGRVSSSYNTPRFAEAVGLVIALLFAATSGILVRALYISDFSVVYVASYTDRALPLFYKLTAFWAGQAGSLLFWAFAVALCGALFQLSSSYARLSAPTRHWYWVFYLTIMAFFALLLSAWSNPFALSPVAPQDGSGLNPLLQNPGMIFHPPLLFLGYGGFTIPACLALAQAMSSARDRGEPSWSVAARPFNLGAWAMLTAGIVLGAWWAYMELGWGGYWAWDPVENASLIPWLVATAALHTLAVETRRAKLRSTNIFLICLTTLSAIFATYLVRSGVVQSVHAFGDGGVGTPLLLFVVFGIIICAVIARIGKARRSQDLAGIESREGFLVLTAWVLLLIALIILVATMWPVFTSWFGKSIGLKADFYNRVCMPIFAGLMALLAVCPWLRWEGGLRTRGKFCVVLAVFVAAMAALWWFEYRMPTPVLGAAAGAATLIGTILVWLRPASRTRFNVTVGAIHAGVAMIAIAIAFSGPYKIEKDLILKPGEQDTIAGYTVTLKQVFVGQGPGYDFLEGQLQITDKNGAVVGMLAPQRRIYEKWRSMQFAEADTLFSLGNELYASLLAVDTQDNVQFRVSLNPLVNWLWIGGTLLTLLPLLILGSRRNPAGKKDS